MRTHQANHGSMSNGSTASRNSLAGIRQHLPRAAVRSSRAREECVCHLVVLMHRLSGTLYLGWTES